MKKLIITILLLCLPVTTLAIGEPVEKRETNEAKLSQLSFVNDEGTQAFIKIYSELSLLDTKMLWDDFQIIKSNTDIKHITIMFCSPGGSAFPGFAIASGLCLALLHGALEAHPSFY